MMFQNDSPYSLWIMVRANKNTDRRMDRHTKWKLCASNHTDESEIYAPRKQHKNNRQKLTKRLGQPHVR